MNLPNMLTIFRILLIPVLMLCYYIPTQWSYIAAAGVFTFAALTDWLDGFLARVLKQTTRFGAFLDPVADKLIVSISLVMIVGSYGTAWLAIPAAVIVGREIVISALREWMAEMGQSNRVQVSWIGKCKTAAQMVSIIILLSQPADFHRPLVWLGLLLLYFAGGLTLWSMLQYLKAGLREGQYPQDDSAKKIEYFQTQKG